MRSGDVVRSVAESVYSAIIKDLPDIEYRAWTPHMKNEGIRPEEAPIKTRRPREDEVEVFVFPQTWGSTALGFGGMGGSAMTSAYTVVVHDNVKSAVYFAGRLAYVVPWGIKVLEAVRNQDMPSVKEIGKLKDD